MSPVARKFATEPYKVAAIVSRRFDVGDARAANATQTDLHDACDMRHLARPTHRAGIAVAFAMDLVAPVDMGIDLQNPDWAVVSKTGEKGKCHGAIATEQDRYGPQC